MYPSQSINARDLKQLLAGKKTITADELAAGLNLDMVGAWSGAVLDASIIRTALSRSAAGANDTLYVSFCDGEQTAPGYREEKRVVEEVQGFARRAKLVKVKKTVKVTVPARMCVFELRFGPDRFADRARFVPIP